MRARCASWAGIRRGPRTRSDTTSSYAGEPLLVADGIRAVAVMSVDPKTGTVDGPYVLIGGHECALAEARALWGAVLTAVEQAAPTAHVTMAPEAMP